MWRPISSNALLGRRPGCEVERRAQKRAKNGHDTGRLGIPPRLQELRVHVEELHRPADRPGAGPLTRRTRSNFEDGVRPRSHRDGRKPGTGEDAEPAAPYLKIELRGSVPVAPRKQLGGFASSPFERSAYVLERGEMVTAPRQEQGEEAVNHRERKDEHLVRGRLHLAPPSPGGLTDRALSCAPPVEGNDTSGGRPANRPSVRPPDGWRA